MIFSVGFGRVPSSDAAPSELSAAELVQAHYDFIWRLLRRMGLSESDTDDATQQVFMATFYPEPKLIRSGSERSFLYGVALNVLREFRRTAAARARHSESALADQVSYGSPFHSLAVRQAFDRLQIALSQMPDDIRSAFSLFELEGLTMSEIAVLTCVPPGTVASRLRRGRELFQSYVNGLQNNSNLLSVMKEPS
jgi:RNA polymerase sigma-70 factor, ECF subfamily